MSEHSEQMSETASQLTAGKAELGAGLDQGLAQQLADKTSQLARLEKDFRKMRTTFAGQLQRLGEVVAVARDLDADYFGDRFFGEVNDEDGFFNEIDVTVQVLTAAAEELSGVGAFADSPVLRDTVHNLITALEGQRDQALQVERFGLESTGQDPERAAFSPASFPDNNPFACLEEATTLVREVTGVLQRSAGRMTGLKQMADMADSALSQTEVELETLRASPQDVAATARQEVQHKEQELDLLRQELSQAAAQNRTLHQEIAEVQRSQAVRDEEKQAARADVCSLLAEVVAVAQRFEDEALRVLADELAEMLEHEHDLGALSSHGEQVLEKIIVHWPDLAGSAASLDELQQRLDEAEAQVREQADRLTSLRHDHQDMQQARNKAEEKLQQEQQARERQQQAAVSVVQELDRANERIAVLEEEQEAARASRHEVVQAHSAQQATQQAAAQAVMLQLDEAHQEQERLQEQLQQAEAALARSHVQQREAQSLADAQTEQQHQALAAERDAAAAACQQAEASRDEAQAALAAAEQRLADLAAQGEEAQAQYQAQYQAQHEASEAQRAQAQEALADAELRVAVLADQITQANEQRQAAEDQCRRVETQLHSAETQCQNAQTQRDEAQGALVATEERLAALAEELSQLQRQAAEDQQRLDQGEGEAALAANDAKQRIAELELHMQQLQQQHDHAIARADAHVDALAEDVSQREEELVGLREDTKRFQAAQEASAAQVQQVEAAQQSIIEQHAAEQADLEQQLQQLQEQLTQQTSAFTASQAQFQAQLEASVSPDQLADAVAAARLESEAMVASLQAEKATQQKALSDLTDRLTAAEAQQAAGDSQVALEASPALEASAAPEDLNAEHEAMWEARLADAQRALADAQAAGAQAAANIAAERDGLQDRLSMVESELQAYRLHAADAAQQSKEAEHVREDLKMVTAKNAELQGLVTEAFALLQSVRTQLV